VKTALWTLLLMVAVAPVLAVVGGLVANRVPLFDPPGALERLTTYLTTHVAETSPVPRFPELAEPRFAVPPERLFAASAAAVDALGWERVSAPDAGLHRAVVTTRLWQFRDDVLVRVEPGGEGGSRLVVRSVSRVGRGDLGANARHVLDLVAEVRRQLAP
jgi:hypothetical protein